MLHDIGVTIDYDDHHRHSHYLIVNSGLPGYSPWELELIAAIARWHRKGEPDAGVLGAARAQGRRRRLLVLCGIIRLAEQFERSRDRVVADIELAQENGAVTLRARTNGTRSERRHLVGAAQFRPAVRGDRRAGRGGQRMRRALATAVLACPAAAAPADGAQRADHDRDPSRNVNPRT